MVQTGTNGKMRCPYASPSRTAYTSTGAPETNHRNGQDKVKAPSMVHNRNALGISLLLRARSGAGVTVVVGPFCEGTGFLLVIPAASRLIGESMIGGSRKARGRTPRACVEVEGDV
jgi:hypothetical protein